MKQNYFKKERNIYKQGDHIARGVYWLVRGEKVFK